MSRRRQAAAYTAASFVLAAMAAVDIVVAFWNADQIGSRALFYLVLAGLAQVRADQLDPEDHNDE